VISDQGDGSDVIGREWVLGWMEGGWEEKKRGLGGGLNIKFAEGWGGFEVFCGGGV
jgi:hypothetical protein